MEFKLEFSLIPLPSTTLFLLAKFKNFSRSQNDQLLIYLFTYLIRKEKTKGQGKQETKGHSLCFAIF